MASWKTKLSSLCARKLVKRPAWLMSPRPIASITFDDFPKNAWTEGGQVLARRGLRATYYATGGLCGRTVEGTAYYDVGDLKALTAVGHEVGCHGFEHKPGPAMTDDELLVDLELNDAFLRPFLDGQAPVSYAYPFGLVSPRTKRLCASRFSSLRGTHAGINAGHADLAQLNVMSLQARLWDQDAIEAAIQQTIESKGWLILNTHDVSENPTPDGSTPGMLEWALDRLAKARISVLPVRDALPVALGFKTALGF